MSCSGRPARSTIALPSPVQVCADVPRNRRGHSRRRQHHRLRAEAVNGAVLEAERDQAAALAVRVHDQVDREIFDEEVGVVLQALLVERVQHGVAGAVGGGGGALHRRALAHILHVAAERALVDRAVIVAAERHAIMFELVDGRGRLAHHIFDRVLVAEPVRPLDGVVHVPGPVIGRVVARLPRSALAPPPYGCGSGRPW
jgi:hypothetical protein